MAADQNDEVSTLKQQLLEKDQDLTKLREEKTLLEENLDEQEENVKDLRKSYQKRIDDLTNDIDEKDEQIDSLSGEIDLLKNNNMQKPEVAAGQSSEVIDAQKGVAEMRDKLNKGGMTINNLHMEIGELKDNLSSAKESVSIKSTKIKEMRDENSQLKSSISQLQQRLDSGDRPGESPCSDEGFGGKVQIEVLKKEMERKNEDLMSTRIQLEKCQKELNDLKQNCQTQEPSQIHSEDTTDGTDNVREEYKLEKANNDELKQQLNAARTNVWLVFLGFSFLILAYVLKQFIF